MIKRKVPKVLVYPKFVKSSYNFKYGKVLLYYPFKTESEIEDSIHTKFAEKLDLNDKLTLIEKVEEKIFKKLVRIDDDESISDEEPFTDMADDCDMEDD